MERILRLAVRYCLAICCGCVIITSCKSTKSLEQTNNNVVSEFVADQYINIVKANNSQQKNLVAKVKVAVETDGKSMSTNGTLRMKKDDVIQISLVDPLLGALELGRMEFTKTHVMIIDRINKQYIYVPYGDVSVLKRANIDFYTLQSLFWNEVFEPGGSTLNAADFEMTNTTNEVNLVYKDNLLTYNFFTLRQSGQLNKTLITNNTDKVYKFTFEYSDFSAFGGGLFPKNMIMSFTTGKQTASLSLSLGSIKNTSDWVTRSSVPSKYSKADPERIFKQLVK